MRAGDPALAAAAGAAAVEAAATLWLPTAVGSAVDAAIAGVGTAVPLAVLGGLLALLVAAEAVTEWAVPAYTGRAAAQLRHRLLDHLLRLGLRTQPRFAPGDLTARLVASTVDVTAAGPAAVQAGVLLAVSGGGLVALCLIDWRSGLAFAVTLPLLVVLLRGYLSRLTGVVTRYQEIQGRIGARLVDALAGLRTIAACGTADREVRRVLAPLPELSAAGRQSWAVQRGMGWRLSLLVPLTQAAVLAVAGLGVRSGRVSPGQLVAIGSYAALAAGLVQQAQVLAAVARSRAGLARVLELAELPAPDTATEAPEPRPGPGTLVLRAVTARAGDRLVLNSVDLVVPAGRTVAVVGQSGAGKTTLAALAGRLIDPDTGTVELDGVPLHQLPGSWLRRQIGYAFARPALLGQTVRGAVSYGGGVVPDGVLHDAAGAAAVDHVLRRLPDGYDTPLAAAPLSGGEAQRVGLARLVARAPRVAILDEVTSSLDAATAAAVTAGLDRALAGATRLVITRSVREAAAADSVVWLESGRVRARGPHATLWADPAYRSLFATAADAPPATADRTPAGVC